MKITNPEDIDLAFSSPPILTWRNIVMKKHSVWYVIRLDEWFSGYVEPTIENIYKGLNTDGIFATNIADYKSYDRKEPTKSSEDWIQVATRIGFKHIQTIKMMLTTRPGVGNDRKEGREKWEGVYVSQ